MNVRYPVYTFHKVPPLPSRSAPVSYDRPVSARSTARSHVAWEHMRLFMGEVFPVFIAAAGGTWAVLLIADCVARATS